jgi:hypothetical protein
VQLFLFRHVHAILHILFADCPGTNHSKSTLHCYHPHKTSEQGDGVRGKKTRNNDESSSYKDYTRSVTGQARQPQQNSLKNTKAALYYTIQHIPPNTE